MTALYAERTAIPSLADCYFYHTMDVPGFGLITGEWDLRGGVDDYLGHQSLSGKRVLEVGTASGFLCFEMERRGAEVVAYDLSPATPWDIVPYSALDLPAIEAERAGHIAKINNSWWLSRHAFGSTARVVYGTVYDMPAAIGPIDICTFGAILLHVRDPLRALQSAAKLRPGTIVVTETVRRRRLGFLPEWPSQRRSSRFLPNGTTRTPLETWWAFTPESMSNLLSIAGYRTTALTYHRRRYGGRLEKMFTLIARRETA